MLGFWMKPCRPECGLGARDLSPAKQVTYAVDSSGNAFAIVGDGARPWSRGKSDPYRIGHRADRVGDPGSANPQNRALTGRANRPSTRRAVSRPIQDPLRTVLQRAPSLGRGSSKTDPTPIPVLKLLPVQSRAGRACASRGDYFDPTVAASISASLCFASSMVTGTTQGSMASVAGDFVASSFPIRTRTLASCPCARTPSPSSR
jgi:hypothetical protein